MRKPLLGLLLAFGVQVQASAAPKCGDLFNNSFSYPPLIQALDPKSPHTIEDIPSYLKTKISVEALRDVDNSNVDYVVIRGAGPRSKEYFSSPEIVKTEELQNPFGAFNVVKVDFKNGRTSYVFTNVNGESRYLQVLSFLRLAHVPESKIISLGDLRTYNLIYRRTFRAIGHVPDLVVFGFSNTSFEIIANAHPTTKRSEYLIRNNSYANKKWVKPKFDEHELDNMGIQVMTFANGKKVWFIDNEYGDRATVLVEALQWHGVDNILLLGTAGALNSSYKVGDIISPDRYADLDGQVERANTRKSSVRKTGEHVHVDSPALETKDWLARQVREENDLVDVELQKASSVIQRQTHYEAYLVISDVLNSKNPQDYTKWNEESRQKSMQALRPILYYALKRIGIESSEPISNYDVQYFVTNKDVKP